MITSEKLVPIVGNDTPTSDWDGFGTQTATLQEDTGEFADTEVPKYVPFGIAEHRAAKLGFNLDGGKQLDMAQAIAGGQESSIRAAVAREQEDRDRIGRLNQALASAKAGVPIDAALSEATKPIDPDTVLEKKFANDFVDTFFANAQSFDSVLAKDGAKKIISRYAYAERLAQDLELEAKNMGWIEWGANVIGPAIVPWAWDMFRMRDNMGGKNGFFIGTNITNQTVKYYAEADDDKAMSTLKQQVDELKKTNPIQALQFVKKFVEYSAGEAVLDTVFSGVDVATGPGMGFAFKQGKAAVRASLKQGKAAVRASLGLTGGNPAAVTAAAGDSLKASTQFAETMYTAGARTEKDLLNSIPLMVDPKGIQRGKSVFSPEAGLRIAENLDAANKIVTELVANLHGQERLVGTSAKSAALEEATDMAARQYSYSMDRVVAVRPVVSNEGTEYASILLGDKNATGFKSTQLAEETASIELGLRKGSYQVTELNPGDFYIDVQKPIDTRSYRVLDKLRNDVENNTPVTAAAWLRSPEYALNKALIKDFKFQGVKASKALTDYRGLMEPIKALSKDGKESLVDLINWQTTVAKDKTTKEIGRMSGTLEDFADDFYQVNKRAPSEAEAMAYFRVAQLHQHDYFMRNILIKQSKESLGLQEHLFTVKGEAGKIGVKAEGKAVSRMPWHEPIGDKDYYGVLSWNGDPEQLALQRNAIIGKRTANATKAQLDAQVEAGSKVVVQLSPEGVENLRRTWRQLYDRDLDQVVTHVVVDKDLYKVNNLGTVHIPRKSGFHIDLPEDGVMVSQATIRTQGPRNARIDVYHGDSNIHYIPKGTDPKVFVERYNKMLQMIRDLRGVADGEKALAEQAADAYIKANLPYSGGLNEIQRHIRRGHIDVNQPVYARPMNTRLLDIADIKPKDGREFYDGMENHFNLYSGDDTLKYAMRRNDPISSVADVGTPGNPVYKFTQTPQTDFNHVVDRTMSSLLNSTGLTALKTRSVTEWVAEFSQLIGEEYSRAQRNPIETLKNWQPTPAQRNANPELVSRALSARRATLEQMGLKSDFNKKVDSVVASAVDTIFKDRNLGRFTPENPHEWANVDDATRFTRNVAFHASMGFFNPVQFFLNMNTMAAINAISGVRHGGPATMAGFMSMALNFNSKPQILKRFDQTMGKFGWKTGDFEDAFMAMKSTGWNDVGRGHALLGDAFESHAITSKGSDLLDGATVFFRRSEQLIRETSWFAAWSEHRALNPTKVFGQKDYKDILQRADVLQQNMTSTSNASWQKGILGVPTQFLSYTTRLTEQFLQFGEKQVLTPVEKLRLFSTYSALYGVPAGGLGASLGAFGSYHENIDRKMREYGWPIDSNMFVKVLNEGLIAQGAYYLTGREWDTSRLAPSGSTFITDMFFGTDQKTLAQHIGGPGITVMGTIAKSLVEGPAKSALSMVSGIEEGQVMFTKQDLVDVLNSFGSGKAMAKFFYADAFVNKAGVPLTDASMSDIVFSAISGLKTKEEKIFREQIYSSKLYNDYVKEVGAEYNKYHSLGMRTQDPKQAQAYFARAQALLVGIKNPVERNDIFRKGMLNNMDALSKMDFKFNTRDINRIQDTK